MKECTDLEVLVMQLKSGEYDGTSIMQAWIAIERLIEIEDGMADTGPKLIKAGEMMDYRDLYEAKDLLVNAGYCVFKELATD